jgi:hypothetical protein
LLAEVSDNHASVSAGIDRVDADCRTARMERALVNRNPKSKS